MFSRDITADNANTYVKCITDLTDAGKIFLLCEYKVGSSYILVNQTEASANQGTRNANPRAPSASYFDTNGNEKLCTTGCSDCGEGVCAAAKDGFALD